MKRGLIILFIFPIVVFYSCEAPRNNPLDPLSPSSKSAVIEGTVQTLTIPAEGIPDVSVIWNRDSRMVKTDAGGKFIINDIQPINGELIFQKEGYITDTLTVMWNGNNKVSETINLNKIPTLDSIFVQNTVKNNLSGSKSYELVIKAKVTDNENNIDSVYFINPSLGFTGSFGNYNEVEKAYLAELTPEQMNINTLETAVGTDFQIYVVDDGKHFNIGSGKISRIIYADFNLIFPLNNAVTDSMPLFQWSKIDAGYSFTYTLEVFRNETGNEEQVLIKNNIPSDSVSFNITEALAPQDYYWVLWVVDNFQNKSRSAPSNFTVQ